MHILSPTLWTLQAGERLNAEIGACACVYVCVRTRVGGMRHREEKKGDTMPPFSQGPFFSGVPAGCICHVLLSCHHSPPAPEIPEHFLKPSSVLLHLLGLAPSRWPQPLGSASWKKPKKHRSSSFLLASVHQPPLSVFVFYCAAFGMSQTHRNWLKC